MGSKQRVERIEQKFNALERAINALDALLKQESPDSTIAKLRAKNLASSFAEYAFNHEELGQVEPDHPYVAKFVELDEKYYAVAAKALRLENPAQDPLANSTAINQSFSFTERATMAKLAPITIPTFDGQSKNWVSWKASFQALIHERVGMVGSVKLSQLQESVQGLAKLVIKEFKPTDENYPLAWAALCKAYDQRRVIVNEHFDALLKLSPALKPTAETTAELMYTVRQHVTMLKAMDITIGEEFVARILEKCLPRGILSRWVDRQSSNKLSKLEELYDFIQDSVFRQREMDELPASNPPAKRAANNNFAHPSKILKTAAHSLVTTSTSSDSACLQCGQSHRLYKCETFNAAALKDKWALVKKHKLCRNCLYAHPLPCTSEKRCRKLNCNRDHHTLLHSEGNSKHFNPQSNQPSKETPVKP